MVSVVSDIAIFVLKRDAKLQLTNIDFLHCRYVSVSCQLQDIVTFTKIYMCCMDIHHT